MKSNLFGYDIAYEIDEESVLASLQNLIVAPVTQRLLSPLGFTSALPSPAPTGTLQQGTLQIAGQPAATLAMPSPTDPDSVALTLVFPQTVLSLDAVAPVLGGVLAFAGLAGLVPTNAGTLTIAFTLRFSVQSGSHSAVLSIGLPMANAIVVSPLSALPAIPKLGSIDLSASVQSAVEAAVQQTLSALFPVQLPIPFQTANACGIGVQALGVKLLSADSSTGSKPALGFFLMLLGAAPASGSYPNVSNLAGTAGVCMGLSNALLLELICCAFQTGTILVGLGPETSHDATSCTWTNIANVNLGALTVTVDHLTVGLVASPGAQSTIALSLRVAESGTGWSAWAQTDDSIGLALLDGVLGVVELSANVTSDQSIDWWVWLFIGAVALVGALIGAVAGGQFWAGAFVGLKVGTIIAALVLGISYEVLTALGNAAAGALEAALKFLGGSQTAILPAPIAQNFGGLDQLIMADFDDLFIAGTARLPASNTAFAQGADVVLNLGDAIDLDHGIVQRVGQTVYGFTFEADLLWETAPLQAEAMVVSPSAGAIGIGGGGILVQNGSLTSMGTANLAVVNSSFWSLTESTLAATIFPGSRGAIGGRALPASPSPYPAGAVVFAVRTTDARLAKCIAWKSPSGQLHLSYVTYDTAVPLDLTAAWQQTAVGPVVSETPIVRINQIARYGLIRAVTRGLPAPAPGQPFTYTWYWDDKAIAGYGAFPGSTATYLVFGDGSLTITTPMGVALAGTLQVEAVAFGKPYVATLQIAESGTTRTIVGGLATSIGMSAKVGPVAPPAVEPPVVAPVAIPPISEQLSAALVRGMNVAPEHAVFH